MECGSISVHFAVFDVSEVDAVAIVIVSEYVRLIDVSVGRVDGVEFICGFELLRAAWADPAVAKAVVVKVCLEFIVPRDNYCFRRHPSEA